MDYVLGVMERPDPDRPITNDDLRVVLALLKQNGVTAPVAEGSRMDQASKLAGKLNFQGLAEKRAVVVPIRPGIEPSAS